MCSFHRYIPRQLPVQLPVGNGKDYKDINGTEYAFSLVKPHNGLENQKDTDETMKYYLLINIFENYNILKH